MNYIKTKTLDFGTGEKLLITPEWKNIDHKPFGEETKICDYYLEPTSITTSHSVSFDDNFARLGEDGKLVIMLIDGEEYEVLISVDGDTGEYGGAPSIAGYSLYLTSSKIEGYVNVPEGETHTVAVYDKTTTIKPIDTEYLPEHLQFGEEIVKEVVFYEENFAIQQKSNGDFIFVEAAHMNLEVGTTYTVDINEMSYEVVCDDWYGKKRLKLTGNLDTIVEITAGSGSYNLESNVDRGTSANIQIYCLKTVITPIDPEYIPDEITRKNDLLEEADGFVEWDIISLGTRQTQASLQDILDQITTQNILDFFDYNVSVAKNRKMGVEWNGKKYENVTLTEPTGNAKELYIGNASLVASGAADTGEPFAFKVNYYYNGGKIAGFSLKTTDNPGEATYRLYVLNPAKVPKLKEEYLPDHEHDSVKTVNGVQPDEDGNVQIEVGSGGGGNFIINLSGTDNFTIDKTLSEILSAITNGQTVLLVWNDTVPKQVYSLTSYDTGGVMGANATFSCPIYRGSTENPIIGTEVFSISDGEWIDRYEYIISKE